VDVRIKHLLSRSLVLAAVVLLAGLVSVADTIKLKNGSVIKGKVVSYNQQEFTVVLDLGASSRRSSSRMVIAAEDVESIEFDAAETGAAAPGPISSAAAPNPSAKRGEMSRETQTPSRPAETPASERETARDIPPTGETTRVTPASAAEPAVVAEKTVSVVAAADWTSTEIRVQRGQRISITADGEVDLGNNRRASPDGVSLTDSRRLIPNRPTGALIAVIGDDNDDFIYVGRSSEFTATHNGILFLSVNEGNLKDNSGSFLARVKVLGNK
jgi:hypothetical protein